MSTLITSVHSFAVACIAPVLLEPVTARLTYRDQHKGQWQFPSLEPVKLMVIQVYTNEASCSKIRIGRATYSPKQRVRSVVRVLVSTWSKTTDCFLSILSLSLSLAFPFQSFAMLRHPGGTMMGAWIVSQTERLF